MRSPAASNTLKKRNRISSGRVLVDERAAALLAHDQLLGGQRADGLARRALADAELAGDLELVGDQLAGLPLAGPDALDQGPRDLAHRGGIALQYWHSSCSPGKMLRVYWDLVLYKNMPATAIDAVWAEYRNGRVYMSAPHFLVHSPKDNVGVVVVEGLKAGTDMLGVITETDDTMKLKAKQDIPIGHKVALKALKKGDTVIKYGEDIGKMVADAGVGEHVHVQNLKTKRW